MVGTLLIGLALGARGAAAFPVTSGSKANDVIGRADYVTGFVDFAVDPFFGGGTSRTRLFVPGDVDVDEANERIFVADVHNHRVLVYDAIGGIPANAPAAFVLGQPDFTTGGADAAAPFGHEDTPNPAQGCAAGVNACGMRRPYSVAYDSVRDRLFVADPDNHRVLVWNLAAGIGNGMAARYVLGQPNFTTNSRNTACGGGSAGPANRCGLAFPSEVELDAANNRLYVADTDNHRVLVFNLGAGITSGMAATVALGQPNLTTATPNTPCGGGTTTTPNACGMASPAALTFDAAGRLFVGELDNRRVTMFTTTTLTSGMAATRVLGQPGFTTATANTACGGGASGEQNTNACGFGMYGTYVELDEAHQKLFVSDTSNHRIVVFDVTTVVNGEAAVAVLGQSTLTRGYDPTTPALGGATTRDRLVMPNGLDYDRTSDRLVVADGGNHRLEVFSANIGGEPIHLAGDEDTSTTTVNANGSVTVDVTSTLGDDYRVVFPPGTTPLPGQDITITVDNVNGSDRPRIRIDAKLPPGTTKSISLPKSGGRNICVIDRTHAELVQHPQQCSGNDIKAPSQSGSCSSFVVNGDAGDNGNFLGLHVITACLDSTGQQYTLSGLLHTELQVMGDDDELGGYDEPGAEPDDGDAPGDPAAGGCAAGGQGGAAGMLLVIALALVTARRRPSTAAPRRR
jgi:hypothetical protein